MRKRFLIPGLLLLICVASHYVSAQALKLAGDFHGTHDPSIAKDGDTYYVFATGAAVPAAHTPAPGDAAVESKSKALMPQFPVRCSKDLKEWKHCGAVFPTIPEWIRTMSPTTSELWAPDVSYYDGLFHLYYAFSAFGKNTSGIALATNVTLDPTSPKYKWVDRGLVVRSFVEDDFNAIDPNLILDKKGEAWLSFGSFWSGIKMRHLDRKTGLLSTTDTKTYAIASRGVKQTGPRSADLPPDSEAIEAPFIYEHDGYYYLFVSWDLCCRGTKSTYREMVGRSHDVTGPYLDQTGKPMTDGGGTPLLKANGTWLGPGGASLLRVSSPSDDLIAFHAYSAASGCTGAAAFVAEVEGWVAGGGDGWRQAVR